MSTTVMFNKDAAETPFGVTISARQLKTWKDYFTGSIEGIGTLELTHSTLTYTDRQGQSTQFALRDSKIYTPFFGSSIVVKSGGSKFIYDPVITGGNIMLGGYSTIGAVSRKFARIARKYKKLLDSSNS